MAHDDDPVMLALGIIFPIISITSVILRFEARRLRRLKLEADDWTILAALVFCVAATVAIVVDYRVEDYESIYATTLQRNTVNNTQSTILLPINYVYELLVWLCVGLTKISVLLLYKRIFVNRATGAFRLWVWGSLWLAVVWTVIVELVSMFSCLPISAHWNPTTQFSCIDVNSFNTAALATDVITDGLILLLPIYKVHKLQMPIQQKLAVLGMFCLGALVTITGIIRLLLVTEVARSGDGPSSGSTHGYNTGIYWSIIEPNAGILSACLPILRPLYEGYRINLLVSQVSSFCLGLRSNTASGDKIRLTSLEQGFPDNVSKVPRSHASDHSTIGNDLDSPLQRPEILPDRKRGQPWRSSQGHI